VVDRRVADVVSAVLADDDRSALGQPVDLARDMHDEFLPVLVEEAARLGRML
jgi:hypothetical protein